MTYVNVSSVQSFMQCRFRWWGEWVMNRVPINTPPPLDSGRLLHLIFEDAFNGKDIVAATDARIEAFRQDLMKLPEPQRFGGEKAIQSIEDLKEALPLWKDTFPVDDVLEVEEPFEYKDPVISGLIWRGRPDRVIISQGGIWHMQNRGLAASMNFLTYLRLAKRHAHEHLYGEYLAKKYAKVRKKTVRYGGTVFNLVRKLKYRTNVGKKNEATKTPAEMFYQQAVSYDMASPLHQVVMQHARQHVREMQREERNWREHRIIPAPNDKLNGGFGGNSEDPWFKVLIGEVKLSDDTYFKDRLDTYAEVESWEAG